MKTKQVNTIGEGITHLIINGVNTDHITTKDLQAYLDYLDNYTAKLRTIVNDTLYGRYGW